MVDGQQLPRGHAQLNQMPGHGFMSQTGIGAPQGFGYRGAAVKPLT
jgi:hypothetical protein